MTSATESRPRYVLGDWGTSRLRLWLVERGDIAATCEGPGIGKLTTSPADTLASLLASWHRPPERLHVVLCGMAGSRTGLLETDYVTAPADSSRWSRSARLTRLLNLSVAVAAGLKDERHHEAPDVMRGEETQIFGALQIEPTLRQGSRLFVLPGTHSKWVGVENGAIVRINTALTGELFALLRDHSILLKTGGTVSTNASEHDEGFAAGLSRSRHLPERLLAALFETRTAQLLRGRSRAWAEGFLSGLLIGDEIAGLSALHAAIRDVVVIGDTQLAELYERAFSEYGIRARPIDGKKCALAGLRQLYESVQGELA